jgi:murein DD-endopeptidase MepM/ murein hydrolase activator NlpD
VTTRSVGSLLKTVIQKKAILMQDRKLPLSSQSPNTEFLNQKSDRTKSTNSLPPISYLTKLGIVASISSLGTAVSLHQPVQAKTTVFKPTLVAELPSLDTDIAENQSSRENANSVIQVERSRATPKIIIQSNLNREVTTGEIPQLPALEVAQIKPKEVTKRIYTVQPGDTITNIARKYGVSNNEIVEANQLTNPNFIKVNHQLVIPSLEPVQAKNQPKIQVSEGTQFSLGNNFKISQITTPTPLSSIIKAKAESRNQKQALESTANNTPETTSVSTEKNTDTYISKLRQDIIKLRTQYQQQNDDNETIAVVKPTGFNLSEDVSEEKPRTATTRVINSIGESDTDSSPSPEQSTTSVTTPVVENLISLLTFPRNRTITPDLPPLSSPEEYLPDNPIFDGYMWPAQGALTSGYGWRGGRMHQGIDIAAPIGTPIMAAASGEVVFAGWNSGGYGNLVQLKHPDGSVTFYAHNNRLLVSNGQKVKQGQLIAEMGSTGRSTGPHLHFEIRPNGTTAINPIARLPKERVN